MRSRGPGFNVPSTWYVGGVVKDPDEAWFDAQPEPERQRVVERAEALYAQPGPRVWGECVRCAIADAMAKVEAKGPSDARRS